MTGGARRRRRVRRTRSAVTLDSIRSAPEISGLSEKDFFAYLKSNYAPLVAQDFIRILQASAASRQPASAPGPPKPATRPAKRKRKRYFPTRAPKTVTVNRYISHAIVLAVSLVAIGRNAPPVVVVLGIGIIGILA